MARTINLIVVHCAATKNGRTYTAKDIDRWHKDRGFQRLHGPMVGFNPELTAIGYHYVILVDGTLQTGRSHAEIGAHAYGHNSKSLGICLIGTDKFTQAQWDTLRNLYGELSEKYPNAKWGGHRDLSPDRNGNGVVEPREWLKTCPGFSVGCWVEYDLIPKPGNVLT